MLRTFLFPLISAFAGCASIVSQSTYPVTFNSTPAGARVEVTNKAGATVFSGTTPATASLASGSSYFTKETYTAKVQKEGYEPRQEIITTSINPWFWGNILFGGVIGALIVDPLTGAMYEVDQQSYTTALERTDDTSLSAQFNRDLGASLTSLKRLRTEGLLTETEYNKKRKELLSLSNL